jgi:hypothetical protein
MTELSESRRHPSVLLGVWPNRKRYRAADQVAVGNGISGIVGPAQLLEGVQLNAATEDTTVEAKGFASCARQVNVGGQVGHAPRLPVPLSSTPRLGRVMVCDAVRPRRARSSPA